MNGRDNVEKDLMEILKSIAEQFPGMAIMAAFAYFMLRMLGAELRRYHTVLDGVLLKISEKLEVMDGKIDNLDRRRDRR